MFVKAPKQTSLHLSTSNQELSVQKVAPSALLSTSSNKVVLLQAIVERLIDGVVLVSEQGNVLQANECAHQICHRLNAQSVSKSANGVNGSGDRNDSSLRLNALPQEVWQVCQTLLESDRLSTDQKAIPELELTLSDHSTVRIRAQKFNWDSNPDEQSGDLSRCILVTLEDRHQTSQHRAIADLLKFNLTPREGEIWQLRLQGYSYREIAEQLYITENTVKKHVKNILAKRQSTLDQQADIN
jgi:RNA polymerase sigma factor (sigma-70 family)